MKHSENIRGFIGNWEGYRRIAYKPLPTDRWTVGFGFTFINGNAVQEGDICEMEDAVDTLEDLLDSIDEDLNLHQNLPDKIKQREYDAVVSLAYNIGVATLKKSQTWHMFCAGENISHKFPEWCRSGGKIIKGLLNRRLAEQQIYDKGIYK